MINRRKFLELAAICGVTLVPRPGRRSWLGAAKAMPQSAPLLVVVHAEGGWDTTLLCDPKGRTADSLENPTNATYSHDEILTRGNISFAPTDANAAFFQKYYRDLLVINGLDLQTNGHTAGRRHMWSGSLANGGPSLSALVSASRDPSLPMSYLSFGGYDATGGVVARTRGGDSTLLGDIAEAGKSPTGSRYHSSFAEQAIANAQRERDKEALARLRLTRRRKALQRLRDARSGASVLARLREYMPGELDRSSNPMIRQAQLVIAAYRANACAAASMSLGGFDTHSDHDSQHAPRLTLLLEGVDFLIEEAARHGVADNIIVVMGSDLGRAPRYNAGRGKDHWATTSVMLMGKGISGNRVIGATNHQLQPCTVNPQTLELDGAGIRLSPAHIHVALRRLAGVEPALAGRFPLAAENQLSDALYESLSPQ